MAKNSYTDWYKFCASNAEGGEAIQLYNLKTGACLTAEIAKEGSGCRSIVTLDTLCKTFEDRQEARDFFRMVVQDLDSYKY